MSIFESKLWINPSFYHFIEEKFANSSHSTGNTDKRRYESLIYWGKPVGKFEPIFVKIHLIFYLWRMRKKESRAGSWFHYMCVACKCSQNQTILAFAIRSLYVVNMGSLDQPNVNVLLIASMCLALGAEYIHKSQLRYANGTGSPEKVSLTSNGLRGTMYIRPSNLNI